MDSLVGHVVVSYLFISPRCFILFLLLVCVCVSVQLYLRGREEESIVSLAREASESAKGGSINQDCYRMMNSF